MPAALPVSLPPSPDLKAFGVAVARRRRELGMTIEQLAEAAGVSRQTIGNVALAHKGLRVETAYALACALDVPLSDLVKTLG